MRAITNKLRGESGIILTGVVMTMIFFITVAVSIFGFAMSHFASARRSLYTLSALEVAEAGADAAMYELNRDTNYTGSGGAVTLFDDNVRGKGTYETTIAPGSFNSEKIITSTAKIYIPRTTSTPFITRKVRLIARGTVPFEYGIHTGTGPLYLFGNTGFTGTVHSNDFIRLQDNGVSLEGGTWTVSGTDPWWPDAPNQCSITGNGSITEGTVRVAGALTPEPPDCEVDTDGSTVIENDIVPAQPLPTIDYAAISAGITTNRPISELSNPIGAQPHPIHSAHYEGSADSRTPCTPDTDITAGLQNVELKAGRTYEIKGNVHIRGDLITDRNTLIVANGLIEPPTILIDGKLWLKGNNATIAANSSGVGVIIAIYDCTDSGDTINGDNDINQLKTGNVRNAAEIEGNSLSLYANFVAPNGSIRYRARGTVGKLAGETIVMNGSGLTTFVDITAGNPPNPTIWSVTYYQQVFD